MWCPFSMTPGNSHPGRGTGLRRLRFLRVCTTCERELRTIAPHPSTPPLYISAEGNPVSNTVSVSDLGASLYSGCSLNGSHSDLQKEEGREKCVKS